MKKDLLLQPLLTLKEAAELLHVSEMTIRRWTNKGTLECCRVGERRARRFMREDLIRFVEAGQECSGGVALRTGSAVSMVPDGSHVTHLCRNEEEARSFAAAYVIDGISGKDTVCIVAPENTATAIISALRQTAVNVDLLLDNKKLLVKNGFGSPDQALHFFTVISARSEGRFRVFGDMSWTRDCNWTDEHLQKLESTVQSYRNPAGCLYMCQYMLDRFNGEEIMMAIENHTHSMYRGQIRGNPYS